MEGQINLVNQSLEDKTDNKRFDLLKQDLKNYCSFQELEQLYARIVPQMKNYETSMGEFSDQYEKVKQMIRGFDVELS